MDDIYWLKKALMQQNATMLRVADMLMTVGSDFEIGVVLKDGMERARGLLAQVDTHVVRG